MRKRVGYVLLIVVIVALWIVVQNAAPVVQVEKAAVGASVNEQMWKLSDDAVQQSAKEFGVHLDYSDKSVQAVENILAKLHQRTTRSPRQSDMYKYGAYVGEVIRRNGYGGDWFVVEVMGERMIALKKGDNMTFPLLKVAKRLQNGDGDDVWAYYAVTMDSGKAGSERKYTNALDLDAEVKKAREREAQQKKK